MTGNPQNMEEAFAQIRNELRSTYTEYRQYIENAKRQEYIGKRGDPITRGINATMAAVDRTVTKALAQSKLDDEHIFFSGKLDENSLMECHEALNELLENFNAAKRTIENLKRYSDLRLSAPAELRFFLERLGEDGTFFGEMKGIVNEAGPVFPPIPPKAHYLTDALFERLRQAPEMSVPICLRYMADEVFHILQLVPRVEDSLLENDLGNAVTYARQLTILYHENAPLDRRDASLYDRILGDFKAAYQIIACLSSMVWVVRGLVQIIHDPKPASLENVDWDSELLLRQSQLQLINIVCDAFIVDCRSSLERRKWNTDRARGAHSKDEVPIPGNIMKKLDMYDGDVDMVDLEAKASPATMSDDNEVWTLKRVENELKRPSTGLAELSLDDSQIELVGTGAYGEVSKINWRGSKVRVAIKRVAIKPDDGLPVALRDFTRETLLWSELRHDNILHLLGFCTKVSDAFVSIALVSPYYEKKDLQFFLHSSEVPERKRLELVRDIASAIAYLHDGIARKSGCIVHGDIRAANVLVSNTERALLCDFGVASGTNMDDKYSAESHLTNIRWLAYELITTKNAKTTTASDIYAFGCLCFEVMHGRLPYFEFQLGDIQVKMRKRKKLPPQTLYPSHFRIQSVAQLMERCWDENQNRRPTARKLVEVLEYMINCI